MADGLEAHPEWWPMAVQNLRNVAAELSERRVNAAHRCDT